MLSTSNKLISRDKNWVSSGLYYSFDSFFKVVVNEIQNVEKPENNLPEEPAMPTETEKNDSPQKESPMDDVILN